MLEWGGYVGGGDIGGGFVWLCWGFYLCVFCRERCVVELVGLGVVVVCVVVWVVGVGFVLEFLFCVLVGVGLFGVFYVLVRVVGRFGLNCFVLGIGFISISFCRVC